MIQTMTDIDLNSFDTGTGHWFIECRTERQQGPRGQDEGVVWVAVANDAGDWAAFDAQVYELAPGTGANWLDGLRDELNVQRGLVLDQFTGWLMDDGVERNEAAAIAAAVIDTEGISHGAERWPDWEHMSDAQRHRAICISLDIPDPLA